ncbi:MAG: hypothetical protein A2Y62_10475 [Candidatus Fischerbacteria bacterium RBG_13_37_8]|uniref:Uncharacterized protein n=1 Tax=Candidatus Fischerbacteria bacterium RBG_13_37_8 TaxID=1817863 RepID=A0A1F5VNV9_9BACT|nr:MAG: hypothetical protein A2Y62_10475 [Candidatus Fischerbacteria bacterium RBG_13_37_8]
MEPISIVKQGWHIGAYKSTLLPEPGKITSNTNSLLNNITSQLDNVSNASILLDDSDNACPTVRSPLAFIEQFPEIILQLYGEQANALKDIAKFIFNFIKQVAQKLGGWDKLIDLIMLVCPLPKHVMIVLEILKRLLPILSPTAKTPVGEFMSSALVNGENTNSPEELLSKMIEGFSPEIQQKNTNNTPDTQSIKNIMADKTIPLEDKVMMVLLSMAEQQETEILNQAQKLDSSSPESRQRLMIELQIQVQKLTQTISALSNMMKTFHEASMNSIRNFR